MKQLDYKTALYLRLSRDDEQVGESNSISTQRMILQQYAEQHDLYVVDEYVDDGYSGTNFDRPDFKRMIKDIEEGRINCVITKDLSRLGRNYLLTGQYIDLYFPAHEVRYIAIDNGVDSINQQSNEFTPFLNVINEWYARDISRKVTKAMRTRLENGAHYGAYAPLGYRKDPAQVGHLVVDEETRWVIEKIFSLAVQGMGASKISCILMAEQVPTPSWFNFQRYGTFSYVYADAPESKRYAWTISQVRKILHDETYIGNSVHNKQTSISYKNKKKIRKPKEEWWTVENTHEAIIAKEDFEHVQSLISSRRRSTKKGTTQIFAGLLKCADCGWSLSYSTTQRKKGARCYYHCSRHSQGRGECTMHYIRYEILYAFVLSCLQFWIDAVHQDEQAILQQLSSAIEGECYTSNKRIAEEIKRAEKRLKSLDNLIASVYEDRLSQKISERNFSILVQKYEKEQEELQDKIDELSKRFSDAQKQEEGVEKWVDLIKKYSHPSELTAELLNTLIEKIVIHEAVTDEDGNRQQQVDIFYRFVGKLD